MGSNDEWWENLAFRYSNDGIDEIIKSLMNG